MPELRGTGALRAPFGVHSAHEGREVTSEAARPRSMRKPFLCICAHTADWAGARKPGGEQLGGEAGLEGGVECVIGDSGLGLCGDGGDCVPL